jgi:hypothetical protein
MKNPVSRAIRFTPGFEYFTRMDIARVVVAACLIFSFNVLAQTNNTIEGRVVDGATREPIVFAHVFISGTTHVTVTDEKGQFILTDIPESGELVVTFIGYQNFSAPFKPDRKPGKFQITLNPSQEALEVVTVAATEDKEWQRNLKVFKRDFLGRTSNARGCEILNPWVLDFDKKGGTFLADASAPLEITNSALGYEVTFYLNTFQSASDAYSIVGPVRFRELDDDSRLEEWERKRLNVYEGSMKHFLRLLWKDHQSEAGFKLYRSVNALEEEQRTWYFERDLGRRVKEVKREDVIRDDAGDGLVLFSLKPLEVHFIEARDFEPVYQDVLHQVSWIQASGGMVRFDSTGNILNPQDVIVSGYWNRLRVADLLPLDYVPGKSIKRMHEPERLKIFTDKGAYTDDSKIWYTVYASGRSLTVNVDLLDSKGNIISSRLDPVERGVASGYFAVPRRDGPFYLRAISSRSLAEGGAFVKPVIKLPNDAMIACPETKSAGVTLNWALDSIADKELLALSMHDTDGDTLSGDYTVSIISDGADCDCLEGTWKTFPGRSDGSLPAEGVPSGTVTNKKGSPQSGKLVCFTSNLSYSLERNTGDDGRFRLEDLIHYDTSTWMVQFYDRKNRPVEDFEIRWDNRSAVALPEMELEFPQCTLVQRQGEPAAVQRNNSKERPASDYVLSDSTRMLDEVTVRGRKISRDARPSAVFRSFGTPQYVVKGEDLAKGNPAGVNLLNALSGHVPGLIISDVGTAWTGETVRVQIRGQSTLTQREDPLVIIDGLPFDELKQAVDLLQTIPLSDIDKVEVRTSLSPMQGMKGTNGVIAVYTKRTSGSAMPGKPSAFVKSVTIKGYSTPPQFQIDSVATSTFFWRPGVEFGWKPVMIETSLLPDVADVVISGIDPSGSFISIHRRLDLRSRRDDQLGSTSN